MEVSDMAKKLNVSKFLDSLAPTTHKQIAKEDLCDFDDVKSDGRHYAVNADLFSTPISCQDRKLSREQLQAQAKFYRES